jgi:hypothetical protein
MQHTTELQSPTQKRKQKTPAIRTSKVIAVADPTIFQAQDRLSPSATLDRAAEAESAAGQALSRISASARRVSEYGTRLLADQARTQKALSSLARGQDQVYLALANGAARMYYDFEKEDKETRRLIMERVNAELEKTGSETRDTTSELMRIVKVNIYGGERYRDLPKQEKDRLRRQCSAYHAVLKEAFNTDIAPEDLVQWIKSKGGIEYIRLKKEKPVGDHLTPKQRLERARNALAARGTLQEILASEKLALDDGDEGRVLVLVGTYRSGIVEINGVVRETKVLDAAQIALLGDPGCAEAAAHVPDAVETALKATQQ